MMAPKSRIRIIYIIWLLIVVLFVARLIFIMCNRLGCSSECMASLEELTRTDWQESPGYGPVFTMYHYTGHYVFDIDGIEQKFSLIYSTRSEVCKLPETVKVSYNPNKMGYYLIWKGDDEDWSGILFVAESSHASIGN